MLSAFEASVAAHQLADVTVAADAEMISKANYKAAGLSFILGGRISDVPCAGSHAITDAGTLPDGLPRAFATITCAS